MSAMMPIMRKAEALLARVSGSDSPEEQRTCGVIFAKLFLEKKLFMVAELPSEVQPPWQAPPEPAYAYRPPAATYGDRPARARTIYAKHKGKCRDCGAWIYAGESCVWLKDTGIWHPECAP